MSDRSSRPRFAAVWFVASVALTLAACSAPPAAPPAIPVPAAPSAPPPAAGVDPEAVIDVDTLLANTAALDGQTVHVTGNFLADAVSAQLCAAFMESYPPQCGGGLRLTGTVPADTLAALETTMGSEVKKMWWGLVTVTGTFRATGDDGRPTLEISAIKPVED